MYSGFISEMSRCAQRPLEALLVGPKIGPETWDLARADRPGGPTSGAWTHAFGASLKIINIIIYKLFINKL